MNSVWEQVIGNAKLISLPEAYLNLKKVLDQDDFSMAEVAVAINNDPALTARLLRLVNSPFYGYSGSIDTVFPLINATQYKYFVNTIKLICYFLIGNGKLIKSKL